MIRILGTIFAGLLGLAFGSFLNVCLSRWPEGESVVQPRSHCRQCGRTLAWWENMPLVSWLALRARCRTCHAWIGWRYPLVEFAVGALWSSEAWSFLQAFDYPISTRIVDPYFTLELGIGAMIFYWLIIALAVLDAENLWLPDWITLPGIVLGFVFSYMFAGVYAPLTGNDAGYPALHLSPAIYQVLQILAAAGLILLIRWAYWLFRRREGIGLGDAKLMAMLAAWLGLPGALLAFVLGAVLGTLVGVVLLVFPSARRGTEGWAMSKLPLGTFLCIGGIVSSLWGQPMIAAYLRWAGV